MSQAHGSAGTSERSEYGTEGIPGKYRRTHMLIKSCSYHRNLKPANVSAECSVILRAQLPPEFYVRINGSSEEFSKYSSLFLIPLMQGKFNHHALKNEHGSDFPIFIVPSKPTCLLYGKSENLEHIVFSQNLFQDLPCNVP